MPAQSSTFHAPTGPLAQTLRHACGWLLAALLLPMPAGAVEVKPPGPPLAPPVSPVVRPLVRFEWQGELRTRGEAMHGLRLSTDPDQPPHLVLRHGTSDPVDVPRLPAGQKVAYFSMSDADLRLRLQPVLHVGEWSDVHAQVDLGRGVVLGGDPRLDGFPDSADPGAARQVQQFTTLPGQAALPGGLAVRRLWLTARLFGFAEVDIGRMGDHFGMGMFRNSGGDLLGDFQDDVDRMAVRADLFGLRLMIARDSLASLPAAGWTPTTETVVGKDANGKDISLPWTTNQAVQRAQQDSADLSRWTLEVHGGKRKLEQGLKWSFALQYATQETALKAEHEVETATSACRLGSCQQLINRSARFLNPELALDWLGRIGTWPLRMQLEGALQYGTFGNIGARTTPGTETTLSAAVDSPLTLVAGGLAGKGNLKIDRHELKVDAGYASGSSDGGFGVNDTDNLRWNGSTRPDARFRTFLSGFHFHRNYRVDGLLFRDVIGAVANTVFVKPAWRFLVAEGSHTIGLEGSVLAAVAASSAATPGKGSLLGIEPELTLDYSSSSGMAGLLRGSLLIPGSAFSAGSESAEVATRIEAVWRLSF